MTLRQQALAFFVAQGWTLPQAAGIVANLVAESGLNINALGDHGKAYGIAQWQSPRQSNFAALMGKPIVGSTFEEQLYFVHAELRGTEKAAGDDLAACTTAAEAGGTVSMEYERPADRDGEASRRAALAQQIFEAASANPAPENAPAPDPGPIPVIPAQPTGNPMELLAALLPSVLQLFAPRAQAAISRVTGQPADVSGAFLADLFAKIQQATGKPDPVQAAAALATAPPTVVKEIENHALDYMDKLAPVIDRLRKFEVEDRAADEASADAAATRYVGAAYDPAILLTRSSIYMVGFLTGFLCVCIIVQLAQGKPVGTELWAALTGMIGWITAKLGTIFDNRFGSTRSSAAKDVVIQQMARNGK